MIDRNFRFFFNFHKGVVRFIKVIKVKKFMFKLIILIKIIHGISFCHLIIRINGVYFMVFIVSTIFKYQECIGHTPIFIITLDLIIKCFVFTLKLLNLPLRKNIEAMDWIKKYESVELLLMFKGLVFFVIL